MQAGQELIIFGRCTAGVERENGHIIKKYEFKKDPGTGRAGGNARKASVSLKASKLAGYN